MKKLDVYEEIGRTIGELFTCSSVNSFVRISTSFVLPDGTLIDLFFQEKEESYILTDLGETLGWLYLQTSHYGIPKNQEIIIKDILDSHKIELRDGMLIIYLNKNENLSEAILRLSQAVIRIADTNYKAKSKSFNSITKEVENFLKEENVFFEKDKKFFGASGTVRKVDFCTHYSEHNTLINVLSTDLRRIAGTRVDKVFTTWSEISYLDKNTYDFISLIDDNVDIWKENDITLLARVSNVINWSDRVRLQEFIKK